ncbi:nucleoside hydrolase-like domain-containing protein [Saccharibacillus endophyticus]|nr:nucleoside hydrolase-like domain-containing protein [Saccharibacillus endophyticus]
MQAKPDCYRLPFWVCGSNQVFFVKGPYEEMRCRAVERSIREGADVINKGKWVKTLLALNLSAVLAAGGGVQAFAADTGVTSSGSKPLTPQQQTQLKQSQARTVVTNDGEVDDMNSMLRFLLYSNEMDLAGIVLTSSVYHYSGDLDGDNLT